MKVEVLNVRVPKEISDWLDSLVKKGVFKSRSEAIREFSRDFVNGNKGWDY